MRHRKPDGRAARRRLAIRCTGLLLLSGLLSTDVLLAVRPALAAPPNPPPDGAGLADPYAAYIAEAAQRFGLPARWIRAVLQVESDGMADAVSSAGAMGLMQIMPDTWNELSARYGLGDDPYDPRDNILAGTAYLRELHDRYGAPGFLAAYNAGPARYDEYLATGRSLPAETRAFVTTLVTFVGSDGADMAVAMPAIDRDSWTRAPLFIARSHDGATAVSTQTEPLSGPTAAAPKASDSGDLAPQSSGLFVALRDRGDGR